MLEEKVAKELEKKKKKKKTLWPVASFIYLFISTSKTNTNDTNKDNKQKKTKKYNINN
jgi:hypothetical protein